MIEVRENANGVSCKMEGKVFDLLAETAVVVEQMAENLLKSAKVPMTYEVALQRTIEAIYTSITETRGINHDA
ncbi:MAG: hypothetical protein E7478_05190 [Ruminococcaceae bacterium]|nr:hypothetical protein [Oscillospiraceae bacterium]